MKQQFNAGIEGGVALRDVHNTTIYPAALPMKPESQLQAEFAARTGVWCPKGAREWFEELLDQDGFTVRELALAWKAGSLGWGATTNEKRVTTPWFEPFAAGILLFIVFALQVLIVAMWTSPSGAAAVKDAVLYIGSAVCFGMGWMVNRQMIEPRRVAMRVRRIAEQRETTNGQENMAAGVAAGG